MQRNLTKITDNREGPHLYDVVPLFYLYKARKWRFFVENKGKMRVDII